MISVIFRQCSKNAGYSVSEFHFMQGVSRIPLSILFLNEYTPQAKHLFSVDLCSDGNLEIFIQKQHNCMIGICRAFKYYLACVFACLIPYFRGDGIFQSPRVSVLSGVCTVGGRNTLRIYDPFGTQNALGVHKIRRFFSIFIFGILWPISREW